MFSLVFLAILALADAAGYHRQVQQVDTSQLRYTAEPIPLTANPSISSYSSALHGVTRAAVRKDSYLPRSLVQQPYIDSRSVLYEQQPLQQYYVEEAPRTTYLTYEQQPVQTRYIMEPQLAKIRYIQPQPLAQTRYISEPKKVVQTRYISEPKKVVQTRYIAEPKPILQTRYIAEPKPILQTRYISEPKPVLQTRYISEPKPVLQTRFVKEERPLQVLEPQRPQLQTRFVQPKQPLRPHVRQVSPQLHKPLPLAPQPQLPHTPLKPQHEAGHSNQEEPIPSDGPNEADEPNKEDEDF